VSAVARREWVAMVHNRSFLILSLMVPAIMIGLTLLPAIIARRQGVEMPSIDFTGKQFLVGLLLVVFLFLGVSTQSQALLRSILEERGNRMLEILLSSIDPLELLYGKIIGYALIALTQFGVWLLAALALSRILGMPFVIRFFQAAGWDMLPLFLACYGAGYLLYASLYAIVASVIGAEREAILYQQLLALALVLPFVLTVSLGANINDPLARELTWIPFMTPTLLLLRSVYEPLSPWTVVGSLALTLATAAVALVLAARLFNGASLLSSKRMGWVAAWREGSRARV
jgi:ABC-2 type transport system permease protein